MKTYNYKSYEDYINCQIATTKNKSTKKWAKSWANEENIKFLTEYILKYKPNVKMGICHGTRNGYEQSWFMKYLTEAYVIGTEIGDTKADFTIHWDFNKVMPDWKGRYDFLYSNSFDHAYNPRKTFIIWSQQVKKGGLVILEYDRKCEHTGEAGQKYNKKDPVSIRFDELIKIIPTWVKSAKIVDVLDMPVVTNQWRKALIVRVR